MIQASQLRSGMCILFEGDVCRVMTAQHVTPGNLGTKILIDTRENRYLSRA